MAKSKKKVAAMPLGCVSRDDASEKIKTLGDIRREIKQIEIEANNQIAEITNAMKGEVNRLRAEESALEAMVQVWCEGNRAQLCADGGKTANLITGTVTWRTNPPSVRIVGAEEVIAALTDDNLGQFLRTKVEVNKEAILESPELVEHIKGIKVVSGQEFFSITPFEVEVVS